jgi:hypothetical protein
VRRKTLVYLVLTLSLNLTLLSNSIGYTSGTFYNQETQTASAFQAWISTRWTQTSQPDFEAGVLSQVDTSSSSGDVKLAEQISPSTIASDNFESGWSGGTGWLWGWWYEGSVDIITGGEPHGGSHHAVLMDDDCYIDRPVDLSGRTNVRLQFWAKANSFESDEYVDCFVYDGVDWHIVQTWEDGDDDNIYRFYDIDLSGYNMSDEFYIAFDTEMSDDDDYLYIDDMAVVEPLVYYGSGTIASQVLDTAIAGAAWNALFWDETLESSTDITFEVRASDTLFLKDEGAPSWNAVGGASPVVSGLTTGRYKQWRATLSSANTSNTPTLHEVRVYYY